VNTRHNIRLITSFSVAFVVVAWVGLMVSYWLPDPAGKALMATSWILGIPAIIAGGIGFLAETEIVEEIDKRRVKAKKTHPLRCSDCAAKILDASGATVEQILPARYDEKGNWHPPRTDPSDRKTR
jgi:hypothetical protein